MRPSLKPHLKEIESIYGKLGEAQVNEFSRLYEEVSSFRHLTSMEKWQELNQSLSSEQYVPLQKRDSMDRLFQGGDEFPDIFAGDPDAIDMNDLV
jgi:hypothetical protein